MSDVAAPGGGAAPAAPASAPSDGVPIDQTGPQHPNPATSTPSPAKDGEVSKGQPPSGKEKLSIDDAIKKAHAEVSKKTEAREKPEAKAEPKKAEPPARKAPEPPPERERGEHGHFASKAGESDGEAPEPVQRAPHAEPPTRFSPEAKAAWQKAPPEVQAEAHRAIKELESGYHKYRQDAEAYHEVRQFDELARSSGTTLSKALANYVTIERDLASGDPQAIHTALQRVFQRAGVDPRQWAAHVLNQPPEQREVEQTQQFQALQREIVGLKQQLQGVAQTQQRQQTDVISERVTAFASKQPRFDELSAPDLEHSIQNLLKMPGMVPQGPPEQRLAKAYELADRLNPSANYRPAPLTPEPRPANGAGTKSIAGSPANGSDPSLPAHKGQKPSIDEAIRRAAARVGTS